MTATDTLPALPLRTHTLLGVCEGIGEDFGFNPMFLRVPLAMVVLYSPTIAIGTYLALSVLVLLSRLVFPQPKPASVDVAIEPAAAAIDAAGTVEQLKLAA